MLDYTLPPATVIAGCHDLRMNPLEGPCEVDLLSGGLVELLDVDDDDEVLP